MPMIRTILALICAACLLLGLMPAQAEDTLLPVYTLISKTPDGKSAVLGSAVLVKDQSTMLTTRWAVQDHARLYVVGNDETLAVASAAKPAEDTDLVVLTLQAPASAKPLALGNADGSAVSVGVTRKDGSIQAAQVKNLTLTVYEDTVCLLYTGAPDVLPGSVLINSQGQLAGVMVAEYGEGLNRGVAYPADVLEAHMDGGTKADDRAGASVAVNWVMGLKLTADKGVMTVDWSSCTRPEGDSTYTLIWEDAGNQYFSYAEVDWSDQFAVFPAVPGRTFRVWLQQAPRDQASMDVEIPDALAAVLESPAASPFTDHSYRDASMYLGCAPVETVFADTQAVPELAPITAHELMNPDNSLYLQVTSTYQVAQEIEMDMVIALEAPDGSVYSELSGFLFMPSIGSNDTWHADITAIVQSCMDFTEDQEGEYTLSYYLDGQLANQIRFVVE